MALSTGCWLHTHINYDRLLIQHIPTHPTLGVKIDVDNGKLSLNFGNESSPSGTDNLELPWAKRWTLICVCIIPCTRLCFGSRANCLIPFSQQVTSPVYYWTPQQHLPTTACPHNNDSLPQIHTPLAPLILAILVLLSLLNPIQHCPMNPAAACADSASSTYVDLSALGPGISTGVLLSLPALCLTPSIVIVCCGCRTVPSPCPQPLPPT